jgi:predicted transcriptional regulator
VSDDPLRIITALKGEIPFPIYGVLRELGIGPEFRELSDNISGWIERTPENSYLIVINSRHAPTRQRFTAAHELGHYIYHRSLIGRGVGDTRAYRSAGTNFPNQNITAQHERQANSFAANVLMPIDQIKYYQAIGVRGAKELAERFGVSEEAMRIRLGLPRDYGERLL